MIDINNFNNLNINTTIVNFDFFPHFHANKANRTDINNFNNQNVIYDG